jgi:hypothetical protein
MDRRTFLATAAVTGSVAIAGCGETSPELSGPTLNNPSPVTYGSDFSLSVIVENTGGKDGKFRATLKSQDDRIDFNKNISITVPADDSTEVTTEPITPPEAGEYTFVLSGEGAVTTETGTETTESESDQLLASTTVTVVVKEVSPGTGVKLNDDLLVTVHDVQVAKSVFTANGGDAPSGVFDAPTGNVFAVYSLTVENVGTQLTIWGPAFVSVQDGQLYGENVPSVADVGDQLNTRRELPAADSVSGYLFAQFPTDAAATGTPLTAQVGGGSAAPEYRWPFTADSTRGFPDFTLTSVTAPQEAQLEQPYEIELTIANTGDGPGTVKAILQYKGGLSPDWTNLRSASPSPFIREEIPAGEKKTVTVTNTSSSDGEYEYRATPFEETWTTTF